MRNFKKQLCTGSAYVLLTLYNDRVKNTIFNDNGTSKVMYDVALKNGIWGTEKKFLEEISKCSYKEIKI